MLEEEINILKCNTSELLGNNIISRDWYGIDCGSCQTDVDVLVHFLFMATLDCALDGNTQCYLENVKGDPCVFATYTGNTGIQSLTCNVSIVRDTPNPSPLFDNPIIIGP